MENCLPHPQGLPNWLLFIAAVGLLSALRISLALVHWLYVTFLRPGKDLHDYGSWAVVTGATDGIGKAFALQLARKGLSLVLVGRSPDRLRAAAEEVQAEQPSAHVETVVVDLAGDGVAEGIRHLRKTIDGMDVGVLVNSAGVSYPYARYFHELEEGQVREMIKVNVEGTTRVTHAVLPGMVERRRGAVVNIGSGTAGVLPSDPLYSVYSATKAYIDQFSRCLYVEYKNKGIDVQCQVPLYVATKIAAIKRTSFFVPSAEAYSQSALRWIGYEPRCTPYWPHSLLWSLLTWIPEFVVDQWRLGFCIGIRKRGQLRDARKKQL